MHPFWEVVLTWLLMKVLLFGTGLIAGVIVALLGSWIQGILIVLVFIGSILACWTLLQHTFAERSIFIGIIISLLI